MATNKTTVNIDFFDNAISIAGDIINGLQKDDINMKLASIKKLNELPKLPRDQESRQLKIYDKAKEEYKNVHRTAARAIMDVLDSTFTGTHDKSDSYNYDSPEEPLAAAEAIKLLPNAFIGGPIKTALNSNDPNVQKIAIDYYESLPNDVRISQIFPPKFNILIKEVKAKVLKILEG